MRGQSWLEEEAPFSVNLLPVPVVGLDCLPREPRLARPVAETMAKMSPINSGECKRGPHVRYSLALFTYCMEKTERQAI